MDTNSADDILRQAAIAAQSLLPELERERQLLIEKTVSINQKISGLQAIIANAPGSSPIEAMAIIGASSAVGDEQQRFPRGQIDKHIDQVLSSGKPMTANEIIAAIKLAEGIEYSRSSLYANFQRGEAAGKYKNDGGRWSKVL